MTNSIVAHIHKRPSITNPRQAIIRSQQNRIIATSPEITLITIDDWEPPQGNYDLISLWLQGRREHGAAPRGAGVGKIDFGYYHYDTWQPPQYKTCPIGAVYVALFGKRSIEIMPEMELMIARICNHLGCTRQELEELGR